MGGIIVVCTLLAMNKRIHPLWVLAAGAVLGRVLG